MGYVVGLGVRRQVCKPFYDKKSALYLVTEVWVTPDFFLKLGVSGVYGAVPIEPKTPKTPYFQKKKPKSVTG